MVSVLVVLVGACALPPPPAWATRSMLSLSGRKAADAMRPLVANSRSVVLVDGNNVRGRVGFRWTKMQLAQLLSTWGSEYGIEGRVVVAWDHGLESQALPWDGVAHVFAGPRRSADDLITDEVGRLSSASDLVNDGAFRDIWLATADRELIHRAKESAAGANGKVRSHR